MALNDGDIAECKEIARVIVKEVLIEHIANCPHHQAFLISKAKILGIMFGAVIASGASSGVVVTIILKIFGS